jgi:serine/threonine protein phosphatase PrpC
MNRLAPVQAPTKRCPGCEATFAEGTFCELCGEILADIPPQHTGMTGPPTMPVALPPDDVPLAPSPLARPLSALRQELTPGQALEIVRKILELARAFERDGLAWQPQPEDFRMEPSGQIVLAQARAVGRLLGQPFDVRRVLWAVRELFLPHPLVGAGADAIRFVFGRIDDGSAAKAIARLDEIVRRSVLVFQSTPKRTATACDLGLLRERNEDSVAAAEGTSAAGSWSALVVCDGVSSSSHGEIASRTGADAALTALVDAAKGMTEASDDHLRDVLVGAITRAHEAIMREPIPDEGRDPSGTTIVAALVINTKIAVGWAGDSRAYLVEEGGVRLLTRDHSWINQALEAGVVKEGEVIAEPLAHALTRCIGPLEIAEGGGMANPDVSIAVARAPARLVLCSDGLWCYFPTPEAFGDAIRGAGARATPAVLCQVLVDHALARGGQDNVAVAVCDLQ